MTHHQLAAILHNEDAFCQTHALFDAVLSGFSDNPLVDAFVAMAQAEYDSFGLHRPERHTLPSEAVRTGAAAGTSERVLLLSSRVREELVAGGDGDLNDVLRLHRTRAFLLEAVDLL